MTEDEMYNIIYGYEDSEREYHERNIELEAENANLRELLSMYVRFARAFAEGCSLQAAYCDGMGKRMDETKMRERALELGVKECR